MESLNDKEIHRAISRVFLYWNVGYNRVPIPLSNLVDFVAQELGADGWKDKLRISLLVMNADRYLVLSEGVVVNR